MRLPAWTIAVSCSALLLFGAAPAHAQRLAGTVVDAATGAAVADVAVAVLRGDEVVGTAVTAADGRFAVNLAAGTYRLSLERIGYSAYARTIEVGVNGVTELPPIRFVPDAVRMDSIEAAARRARPDTATGIGARTQHVLAGARLAKLEGMGVSRESLVRELGAGLRIKRWGSSYCVEASRRAPSFMFGGTNTCDWPAIVIDGVLVGDPAACGNGRQAAACMHDSFFRSFHPQQWESIQYIPPLEAATRFGMAASAAGAIEVWTRGNGPWRNPAREPR